MGANDLILQLRTSGFSISAENSRLRIAPADKLTEELKQTIQQRKVELLTELQQEAQQEARRQKVLTMLQNNPDSQRASITDSDADPEYVIITIAVRSIASFEMLIPREKYDPFLMLEAIDRNASQHIH